MRATALLVNGGFSSRELRHFYSGVQRRTPNEAGDTLAFECLTMSLHNLSSIESLRQLNDPCPVVRSAIIAWYYAVYYAAKAMLAATSGTNPQNHAAACRSWQSEIVIRGLVREPFELHVSDITPQNVAATIEALRSNNPYDLNAEPIDRDMALGALYSYLKGTASYERERLEQLVKDSSDFRHGGHTSFRSRAARDLRDAKLRPASVNYLVQAFRFRGKANYRDAIYLSYGRNNTARLEQFVSDLAVVSRAFVAMAAHYASRRVVRDDWTLFIADIQENLQFGLPLSLDEI
ncbi:MAG: hypothetical protein AAF728_12065 [Cyanobacteria bacterium P01_D01_bin.128]